VEERERGLRSRIRRKERIAPASEPEELVGPLQLAPDQSTERICTTTILARLRNVSGDGRVARLRRLSNARWLVERV
jgi:hypothetical protein